MVESATENTTIRPYAGNPYDITNMTIGRVDVLVKKYSELSEAKISKLPKEIHIETPDGKLKLPTSLEEIRIAGGSGKPKPSRESVDVAVEEFFESVRAEIPLVCQEEVRKGLRNHYLNIYES